ncbi:hypothetical protein [uncultured Erythrobacter sp.]|uniref:hypothetical protein n=1 Tax=uncultured Erythrobacter sp. TaxID=263913 RepID=UPI002636EEF3|nr:hypothetical protein [uncultured Erythrobacter sp.]
MKFLRKQSATQAFEKELMELLIGLYVRLERDTSQWSVLIGQDFVITTLSWRLIGAKSIIVTDEDDGHKFGLPEPVDAKVQANDALNGYVISRLDIDRKTGDLSIQVGDGLIFQIVSSSSGYEIWQVYRKGEFFGVVGSGGLY